MARQAIVLSFGQLQQAIYDAENLQPNKQFSSRSALWAAVIQQAGMPTMTPQTAMLKAQTWGCVVSTPVGKKGRAAGTGMPAEAIAKRGKKRKRIFPLDLVAPLKNAAGPANSNLADRVIAGNVRAAVKLNCLICSGHSKKEVALCCCTECPFYTMRPFKHPLTKTRQGRNDIMNGKYEDDKEKNVLDGCPVNEVDNHLGIV